MGSKTESGQEKQALVEFHSKVMDQLRDLTERIEELNETVATLAEQLASSRRYGEY